MHSLRENLKEKLIAAAKGIAKETGVSIDPISFDLSFRFLDDLRDAGFTEEQITRFLASSLGFEFFQDLSKIKGSPHFTQKIPIWFARKYGVLGLESENGVMPVALSGLKSLAPFDVLSRYLDHPTRLVFTTPCQMEAAINQAYEQQEGEARSFVEKISGDDGMPFLEALGAGEDLLDTADRAPVIKLVNLILFEAVKQAASDIHIHPKETNLVVRMRIDGILFDAFTLPTKWHGEVVSRIKVMGKMDIAEKRIAQDGRTSVQVGDRRIDLRISAIPTSFGERIVIRLLDKSARMYQLEELGMHAERLKTFRKLIRLEHGLILVTGPTGSGKSTTLYAALQEINSTEKNILTLEDPIEYKLEGISQTQVNLKKGMTFAKGLRNVLRQDPDIIMVGEIRDHETAVMAIQSALTGHMVFSTLHTNDAPSAIARLLDLGIEPYLMTSSLIGVLAQRLVRRVCAQCKKTYAPGPKDLKKLQLKEMEDADSLYVGTGCPSCRQTGYQGRIGLFELLMIREEIQDQIQRREPASTIRSKAVRCGMRTLRDDGILKVLKGVTTIDEVFRVTMLSLESIGDE